MFSDFEGLDGLISGEVAASAGTAAAGGALATALHAVLTDLLRRDVTAEDMAADGPLPPGSTGKMPYFGSPLRKALVAGVVGVGGGYALWTQNEDMAKGAVGAMASQLTNQLYDLVLGRVTVRAVVPEGQDRAAFVKTTAPQQLNGFAGALAGAGFAGYLNDAAVLQPDEAGGAFADAEVEDEELFGTMDAIAASY